MECLLLLTIIHIESVATSPSCSRTNGPQPATVRSCHPALLELHWLPIAERTDFKLCLLVHKALVGQAPQYIADLIRPVADLPPRASSRSALSGNLFLPRTRRKLGDWSFAVMAPRVWNSLPILTSNSTNRQQHLSNAVLKLFYLIGASLNICKWLWTALPVVSLEAHYKYFSYSYSYNIQTSKNSNNHVILVYGCVVRQYFVKHVS